VTELQVDKLPRQFQIPSKDATPENLRRESNATVTWVLRDLEWYYELDKDVIRGKDSKGRTLNVLDDLEALPAPAAPETARK
jgi:hypothetical protein